jgi:pimeloyl-ACP methyl ester carboxylesterase
MIRAALLAAALLLAVPAAGLATEAGPLRMAQSPRDAQAVGALVWLHPHYTEGPPPAAPGWMARLTGAGWDLWRHDRVGGRDPLEAGAAGLAIGAAALRARGYRHVVLVGESRGAFIALLALRQAGLADAVVLAAPAAHGTRAERRPQALADFRGALEKAAVAPGQRLALLLFRDDAYDPDPDARAAAFRAAVARGGAEGLVIDRPAAPTGHGGVQEADFDRLFGACLAAFLDFDRTAPRACP